MAAVRLLILGLRQQRVEVVEQAFLGGLWTAAGTRWASIYLEKLVFFWFLDIDTGYGKVQAFRGVFLKRKRKQCISRIQN